MISCLLVTGWGVWGEEIGYQKEGITQSKPIIPRDGAVDHSSESQTLVLFGFDRWV